MNIIMKKKINELKVIVIGHKLVNVIVNVATILGLQFSHVIDVLTQSEVFDLTLLIK